MVVVAYAVGAAGLLLPTAASTLDSHYVSTVGRFAVTFPKADGPTALLPVDTPLGTGGDKLTVYAALCHFKGGVCMVAFADYPTETVLRSDPEAEAEATADGVLGGLKAKELSLTRTKVFGRTARELAFDMPDGRGKGKARVFYVDNRLYQLIAYDKDGAAVDPFLDSFELFKAK